MTHLHEFDSPTADRGARTRGGTKSPLWARVLGLAPAQQPVVAEAAMDLRLAEKCGTVLDLAPRLQGVLRSLWTLNRELSLRGGAVDSLPADVLVEAISGLQSVRSGATWDYEMNRLLTRLERVLAASELRSELRLQGLHTNWRPILANPDPVTWADTESGEAGSGFESTRPMSQLNAEASTR